jgi:hypothetical protein
MYMYTFEQRKAPAMELTIFGSDDSYYTFVRKQSLAYDSR